MTPRSGWLRRRLLLLTTLTSGTALLVASIALVAWESVGVRSSMRGDLWSLAGSAALALLASLALAGRLRQPIVGPIEALADRGRAIGRGSDAPREGLPAPGELGILADAFDGMAAQIRDLREARDRAEQASRAKSELLADLSQEIRAPIDGIAGLIELALDGPLGDEEREQLQLAAQSSDSLLALVDDVLVFSKIEAGRLEVPHRMLSLRETLGRALRPLALRAAGKGLALGYRVAPSVPERLVGDPDRLARVVAKLVGSAVELTRRGSIGVEASLEEVDDAPAAEDLWVRFVVRHTGPGTRGEDLERAFGAFTQERASPTRTRRGADPGLVIARRLVEQMGGRVAARSAAGAKGHLEFTVRFERAAEDAIAHPLRGRRALLVEADAMVRETARFALADAGAAVSATSSPALAAHLLEAERADVIVADAALVEEHAALRAACRAARAKGATAAWLAPAGSTPRAPCGLEGATVTRPFPPSALVEALCRDDGSREAARPGVGGTRAGRSLRILLAGDDPAHRVLAEKCLRRWGHSVASVRDGEAAVRAAEETSFDLILMDVQLPDGLEATARIRRHEAASGRRTPIVAMAGRAQESDRERFLEAGMDDYLPRPARSARLLAVVGRVASARATGTPAAISSREEERLLEALGGDRVLLSEIARLFVADAPLRIGELRSAVADGDEAAARRANHTLTGAAGNFAEPEVNESLRRLGRLLRSGALRDPSASERLHRTLVAAERHVGRLVERLARVPGPAPGREATRG